MPTSVRDTGRVGAARTNWRYDMRVLLAALFIVGGILLALLIVGVVFSNLRFFIWLAIIGLVLWGIYMLITRPWRYS
jgi:hypothetical protein